MEHWILPCAGLLAVVVAFPLFVRAFKISKVSWSSSTRSTGWRTSADFTLNRSHHLAPAPILVLLVLVASLVSAHSGAAERPDRLVFAWPDGATAEVTYAIEGWRRQGGTSTTVRRSMKYQMRVAWKKGGRRVIVERIWPNVPSRHERAARERTSLFGSKLGPSNSALQNLVDDLPEYVPLLHVSRDGRLVSVSGEGQIDARLKQALAESEANHATRRQLNALVNDQALYDQSVQAWGVLVTAWAGRHLEDDFAFEDRSGADVPGKPMRVEVPGHGRFEGWVPCTDAGAASGDARCVKLRWSASPQGDDAKAAVEALEERAIDDLELTREITVVTDPRTLLPYSTVDHLVAKRTLRRGTETLEAAEEMTRRRTFVWSLP